MDFLYALALGLGMVVMMFVPMLLVMSTGWMGWFALYLVAGLALAAYGVKNG